jgi:hypothetical protein
MQTEAPVDGFAIQNEDQGQRLMLQVLGNLAELVDRALIVFDNRPKNPQTGS